MELSGGVVLLVKNCRYRRPSWAVITDPALYGGNVTKCPYRQLFGKIVYIRQHDHLPEWKMKASVAACMLGFHVVAHAAVPAPLAPAAPLLPRLTEDAIHKAVREVLDENPKENGLPHETSALRGDKYENFSRQFSDAQVPDCLRPDGLKRQPTSIMTPLGPAGVTGLLAAPFVLVAKMRGKCH